MSFARKWENPAGTKEYYAWRSMRSRCYNAGNQAFKNYGERGITVCDSWINNYDAFYSDMGKCPDGMSLERINTNGNYEPENCRWATASEQGNNQRRSRKIEIQGRIQTITQWANEVGLRADTAFRRIDKYGIPPERALTETTLRKPWRHGTRQGYEKHKCKCADCRASNAERHRLRRRRIANVE